MNKNSIRNGFVLLAVMALLISACASGNSFRENDEVTVQLSWFHSVEYAGFYTALEKGYYAEENIAVTLVAGGPETDTLSEVNSGNAQFGISTGDSLIIARSNQQNFVAVATIFRNNPLVAMALDNAGIDKPADFTGKNIGVIAPDLSTTWDIQFLALLQRMDIPTDSMNFSAVEDYHGANELKTGKVDVMTGMFATNEPVLAKMEGDALNLIYYKDYGVDVYANTIFVAEEFKQNNPDLITRFIRATFKGYQDALENPEETASFAVKYDETLDLAYQQAVMQAQIPFIDIGDGQLGGMNESVWTSTQSILLEFGLIPEPIDLSVVYTNEFVTP